MPLDPYGYDSDTAPAPEQGSRSGFVAASVITAVLALSSLCCAAFAGGMMQFGDEEVKSSLSLSVGVWMIFAAPAFPLFAASVTSVLLYRLTRSGWSVAGPNLLLGGGVGCAVWLVLFLSAACMAGARGA